MELIPVKSTNVEAIGWEANVILPECSPKNILRVKFTSGLIYDYLNVPEEIYLELMAADSKGSYIYRKIRNNYISLKVRDE